MYKIAKPLFLHCQTPTHVGSGSDLGIVDLPIQRESHTLFPKFESSSLKGALRQRFEDIYPSSEETNRVKIHLVFGYDEEGESPDIKKHFKSKDSNSFEPQYAGAIGFTDARLLFFPVKSMRGVFALVTCPYILERLVEDLSLTSTEGIKKESELLKNLLLANLESAAKEAFCYTLSKDLRLPGQETVILEEYSFTVKTDYSELAQLIVQLEALTGIKELSKKLVILHNDDFTDFVTLHTEAITRNKIGENGVVVNGALFTEEFLPAESVLYALVLASPIFQAKKSDFRKENKKEEDEVLLFFKETITKAKNIFQIGGNATLGKGIVKLYL